MIGSTSHRPKPIFTKRHGVGLVEQVLQQSGHVAPSGGVFCARLQHFRAGLAAFWPQAKKREMFGSELKFAKCWNSSTSQLGYDRMTQMQ